MGQNNSNFWRPCSFTPIHSLTGPMVKPFASSSGGSGSRPGDAPAQGGQTGLATNC
jgi:hypothetical protein